METTIGVLGKRQLFQEDKPEDKGRGYVSFDMTPPAGVAFQAHKLSFAEAIGVACRFVLPGVPECELMRLAVPGERASRLFIKSGRFGIRLMASLPEFVMNEGFHTHVDKTIECGTYLRLAVHEDPTMDLEAMRLIDRKNDHYVAIMLLNTPWCS